VHAVKYGEALPFFWLCNCLGGPNKKSCYMQLPPRRTKEYANCSVALIQSYTYSVLQCLMCNGFWVKWPVFLLFGVGSWP
jgi:hypothetical protein